MKKTLLVVATASSMLLGSMLAQAEEATDADAIQNYVLELDTNGMTAAEIEDTRGEFVVKAIKKWGVIVGFKGEFVKGTRRNSQGRLESYWRNH